MAAVAETVSMHYRFADEIPGLAEARQEVRQEAWALLSDRKALAQNGHPEQIPLAVDALSTAEFVLEAEAQYGKESRVYQERFEGLQLDCKRLLAEWYRKNRPEYFGETTHFFNASVGDFFSHGLSTRQMTENALVPIEEDPEEEGRRINERVEDATPLLLRKLGGIALAGTRMRTISECSNKAIADYQSGTKRGYNGYVPEIEKMMIRDIKLDAKTGDRYEEQVGLPGIYLTHYVVQEALRRRSLETGMMDKTALHGSQILAEDDLIEFVQLLDEVASEEWCTTIFMGEQVDKAHPRNYAEIRAEAAERQAGLANQARTVALFIVSLAENNVDRRKAPELVETFVKRLLLQMSEGSYEIAAQIFDEKTAQGLQEVTRLRASGFQEEAIRLFEKIEIAAPGGGYCGAGSCGLESISASSYEQKLVKDRLGFGDAKDVIKDTERKCRCGAKTVYYDLKQGKKGCTTCSKTAKY